MTSTPMNDRERWDAKYASQALPERLHPPGWLVEHRALLPPGEALDLATGLGHGAIWLAREGWRVTAIDVSPVGLELARRFAEREAPATAGAIAWRAEDLATAPLPCSSYDVIVCTRFLVREDFPARILAALRPGGVLVYETFTVEQLGQPGNHFKDDRFLLKSNELLRMFAPLKVLRYREGVFEGQALASVVAQK
jgi:tellurite methyltransferase